jgi:hypothetical protein
MLRYLVISLSGLSLIAALVAAHWWWHASRINTKVYGASACEKPEIYIYAIRFELSQAAWMNSQAAIWTALSAILSATAALLGSF